MDSANSKTRELELFKNDLASRVGLSRNDIAKEIDRFENQFIKRQKQAFFWTLVLGGLALIAIVLMTAFIVTHIP